MARRIILQFFVSPLSYAAIIASAKAAKSSVSAWCVEALNTAAGVGTGFVASKRRGAGSLNVRRSQMVQVWVSRGAKPEQWEAAAQAACMTLAEWSRAVIDVATGSSALADQLRRVRS